MKKLLLTISIVILSMGINLFGQVRNFENIQKEVLEQLDMMGVNSKSLLNSHEGMYLNVIFLECRGEFDLTGKKVGFILRGGKSDKKEYFDMERERFIHGETPNGGKLYVFDSIQKEESGGYDAVIVYWSKVLLSVEDVIDRLKR